MEFCIVCRAQEIWPRSDYNKADYECPKCNKLCTKSPVEPIQSNFCSLTQAIATFDFAGFQIILQTLRSLISSKQQCNAISVLNKRACTTYYRSACFSLINSVDISIILEWRDNDNNTFLHLLCDFDGNDNFFDFSGHIELNKYSVQKLIDGLILKK